MGRRRTASIDTVRVPLSEGDWLECKRELSVKDFRGVMDALTKGSAAASVARMLAWVHEWSLRDDRDKPIPVTEDGINALALKDFGEVNTALDAHIAAMDAEAEKNDQSDPPAPATTSPSAA